MRFSARFASLVLAVSATMSFAHDANARQRAFTPAPAIPLHDYDYARGQDVQRFNGLFAKRIIEQTSSSDVRTCLRDAPKKLIVVRSFALGAVQLESFSLGCLSAPSTRQSKAVGPATATVSISAARLLALGLANDKFNQSVGFAQNDRDLADYDVEFFDGKDGNIHIFFTPQPQKRNSEIAGCPHTGPIDTTYIIDNATFTTRIGRMAC